MRCPAIKLFPLRRTLFRSVIFLLAILCLAAISAVPRASAFESEGSHAILVDFATGAVLYEKNADQPMPPASMSKLMTVYMVFDELAAGRLSLQDTFRVSEKAWRKGGSKMFVEVESRISVEDLLRGVIVQSGNDACIVLAEGLAGTEEAFADQMNEKAREIGLTNSHFVNATGWPDPGHEMSSRDMAILSHRLISDFSLYYVYFSELEFTFNGIRQGNRNPLLYKNVGADGLKTGYTEASGYGLTASAVRNDRRLILVVNGLGSVNQRSQEAERMLEYGFREFDNYLLLEAGELVTEAAVWLGDAASVPLVIEREILVTMASSARAGMKVSVSYDGPVPAPIEKGAPMATLTIEAPGMRTIEASLVAGNNVRELSPFARIGAALNYLLWGPGR
jgi:D-alanyl-D-alanine carboxypeptidase (penicillin-binding protein 5/6)